MDATIKIAIVGILGRTAVITVVIKYLWTPEKGWCATFFTVLGFVTCYLVLTRVTERFFFKKS